MKIIFSSRDFVFLYFTFIYLIYYCVRVCVGGCGGKGGASVDTQDHFDFLENDG